MRYLVLLIIGFIAIDYGLPVGDAVNFTRDTVRAPKDWDEHDAAALGGAALLAIVAWRKRPRFLRVFDKRAEKKRQEQLRLAVDPLRLYEQKCWDRAHNLIAKAEEAMRNGCGAFQDYLSDRRVFEIVHDLVRTRWPDGKVAVTRIEPGHTGGTGKVLLRWDRTLDGPRTAMDAFGKGLARVEPTDDLPF